MTKRRNLGCSVCWVAASGRKGDHGAFELIHRRERAIVHPENPNSKSV